MEGEWKPDRTDQEKEVSRNGTKLISDWNIRWAGSSSIYMWYYTMVPGAHVITNWKQMVKKNPPNKSTIWPLPPSFPAGGCWSRHVTVSGFRLPAFVFRLWKWCRRNCAAILPYLWKCIIELITFHFAVLTPDHDRRRVCHSASADDSKTICVQKVAD